MTNKEAIVWLKECKEHYGEYHEMCDEALDIAIKALEERPQGEWLTNRVAFHLTCPFCGCNLRALKDKVFEGDYEYNFCPNCGARMTKEAENECKNDT